MCSAITKMFDKPKGYFDSHRSEILAYIPDSVKRTSEFGCGAGGFSAMVSNKLFTAEARFASRLPANCLTCRVAKLTVHSVSSHFRKTPHLAYCITFPLRQ